MLCGITKDITMKCYSQMLQYVTYEARLAYLQTHSRVGAYTYGGRRDLNQGFYRSAEWRSIRDQIIFRDKGCDMALPGHEILGRVLIHHIEPIDYEDILRHSSKLIDLDNLVCVSFDTHQRIHYMTNRLEEYVDRRPNDMIPWR